MFWRPREFSFHGTEREGWMKIRLQIMD
jgi:hypothetical protein